jgi:hypothetical protein
MAETVTIASPSPSYALLAPERSPLLGSAALSKKSLAAGKSAAAAKPVDSAGVAKRKQSKSRNGMLPH